MPSARNQNKTLELYLWRNIMLFFLFIQLPALCFALVLIKSYYVFWKKSDFWEKKGIPCLEGSSFPFGVNPLMSFQTIMGKKHTTDITLEQYEKNKDKPYYGGYAYLNSPVLIVNDPSLIKSILVKNFSNFVDRQSGFLPINAKAIEDQALARNFSSLSGDKWKTARSKVSPVFTASKLKFMFDLMKVTTAALVSEVDRHFSSRKEVDIKVACSKLTMDTIASCAFGLETNSFQNQQKATEFMTSAKRFFQVDFFQIIKGLFFASERNYKILEWFGYTLFPKKETGYLVNVIQQTIRQRESGRMERRNDLIDLMLKAMKSQSTDTKEKVEELDVIGNSLAILMAGFEATASTLIYTLYELAMNKECQEQLFEEIEGALQASELDYNAIMELPYLDQVINESMRLHSTAPLLIRACNSELKVDEKLTITPGTLVVIPQAAIHQDSRYWEQPKTFNPDHFCSESVKKRDPYVFMPFGHGPRNCIGMRFGLLELKMAIVALIKKYKLLPTPNTPKQLTSDPGNTTNWPKEDIFLKFELRN